jgi:hypothetical protein
MGPETDGQRTPLYPIIRAYVEEHARVISEKLMAWRMFSANWRLDVTDFYGKRISYDGAMYEGTPEVVFWDGFIEPFLRNAVEATLKDVLSECGERSLDPARYLDEACVLLEALVEKTYTKMSDIDRHLRGHGFPKSVQPRTVSHKIQTMHKYGSDYREALTHRRDPKSGEIVTLRPSLYGISIDLKAAWQWLKNRLGWDA